MEIKLEECVNFMFILLLLIGHVCAHDTHNENNGTATTPTDQGNSTGSRDQNDGWEYHCGCDAAPDGSWTYKWGTGSGPDGSTYGYGSGSSQSPDGGGFGFGWGSSSSSGDGGTDSSGVGASFGLRFGSGSGSGSGGVNGDGSNGDDGSYWLEHDPSHDVQVHRPKVLASKYKREKKKN